MAPLPRQQPIYELTFYESADGDEPARRWMQGLHPTKRRAVGYYLNNILGQRGIGVCDSEWGRALGQGLYEFRVRDQRIHEGDTMHILLRVFFHPFGAKNILLLHGYDKGEHSSHHYQEKQIAEARKRLKDFQVRSWKS